MSAPSPATTPAEHDSPTPRPAGRLLWIPRGLAALIMGQTLFFKFSAAPESVAIFETLGMEPWGRLGTGVLELVALILLFVRPAWGGLLGSGLMLGAIGAHLTKLGIVVGDDGGSLFAMALVALACCALTSWSLRRELPRLGR